MVLMYRVLNLEKKEVYGYFYERNYAVTFIQHCGLENVAIVQEVNIAVDGIRIIKHIC